MYRNMPSEYFSFVPYVVSHISSCTRDFAFVLQCFLIFSYLKSLSHCNIAWSLFSVLGISHFLALNKTAPLAMKAPYGQNIECLYINVMLRSWMLCSIYQQANIFIINWRCPIKLKDEKEEMISQNRKWCHYVPRLLAKARAFLEYKMASAGAAIWLPDTERFFMELRKLERIVKYMVRSK